MEISNFNVVACERQRVKQYGIRRRKLRDKLEKTTERKQHWAMLSKLSLFVQ